MALYCIRTDSMYTIFDPLKWASALGCTAGYCMRTLPVCEGNYRNPFNDQPSLTCENLLQGVLQNDCN